MLVLGYYKLTSKKGLPMTKVQCVRDYTPEEVARKLNRQRCVFPSDTALLKVLYLATFEATKKWTMSIRNWGQVYGELSIMYEGRLPE